MGACLGSPSTTAGGNADYERTKSVYPPPGEFGPVLDPNSGLRNFRMRELEIATNRFSKSNVLGEGSFGKVYKGVVEDWTGKMSGKRTIAVKKLDPASFQGFAERLAEVLLLGNLKHQNLVQLLGFCTHGENERLLVYEFLEGGSLDTHLYSADPMKVKRTLTWQDRVRISLEIAEGLAYLHRENIIHRDFKSCNILLDGKMTAKVTDFGLATSGPDVGQTHISTRVMGTMGYLDPKYMETGHLSPKSDVYAFGVVLLELLTGRQPMGENENDSLTRQIKPYLEERRPNLEVIMDRSLGKAYSKQGAMKLSIIARYCVNEDSVARPAMAELLEPLRRILDLPIDDHDDQAFSISEGDEEEEDDEEEEEGREDKDERKRR